MRQGHGPGRAGRGLLENIAREYFEELIEESPGQGGGVR